MMGNSMSCAFTFFHRCATARIVLPNEPDRQQQTCSHPSRSASRTGPARAGTYLRCVQHRSPGRLSMLRPTLIAAAAGMAMATGSVSSAHVEHAERFHALLSGFNEVPALISDGQGTLELTL